MRTLVVSPHPDDSEIGCGGLIRRRRRAGLRVDIAVCTGPGDLTMAHSGQTIPFSQRMAEQAAAAIELGSPGLVWLSLAPASRFDTVPQAEFVTRFDDLFRDYDEVVLPLPSYNDDHARVWAAGVAAFRPGRLDATALLAYEQIFGGAHAPMAAPPTAGRRYVPIDADDLDAKVRAVGCHGSQVGGRPDGIYGEAGIRALARTRGLEIGYPYAEMLYLLREVRSAV